MKERLGQNHWIDAGLKTLREAGVDAVRVEPLAKALGVTKGSFYWHFADRSALLSALLAAWEERATEAVIRQVEAAAGAAPDRLAQLFRLTVGADGRLERAIRHWAAHDNAARAAQQRIDARRITYVASLFEGLGFSPEAAMTRAQLAYLALIGHYAMSAGPDKSDALPVALDAVIGLLTQKL
ncbi:MAG: TetR/AcrR family transcriptional regulator [Beijerinckiaceae bacterium]